MKIHPILLSNCIHVVNHNFFIVIIVVIEWIVIIETFVLSLKPWLNTITSLDIQSDRQNIGYQLS
jgi:hypothetical protein